MGASLAAAPLLGLASSLQAKVMAPSRFKLGIITDEITADFDQALNFIAGYSLHYCELRDLWGKYIMELSPADLDRAKQMIGERHLQVSDIGTGIFKWNLPEMPGRPVTADQAGAHDAEKNSDEQLKKAFELAHFFGTRKVRIFSYWRVKDPGQAYPRVRDRLARAAELAGRSGVLLLLENEMECNVGTGNELGRILRDINSSHLRGNWDPGNAAMLHEAPYPGGYRHVMGLFSHMHIKDVKKDPKTGQLRWAPVGGGAIDWKGQIQALVEHHYDNTMSLETHYRRPDGNKMESTRESLLGLLKIMNEVA